jgi:phenylacetate-CoA ligase
MYEQIRRAGFLLLDRIQQRIIGRHIDDIRRFFLAADNEKDSIIRNRLNSLLNHAVISTPFYKGMKGFTDLNDFTVIEKKTVKTHYVDFFSNTANKKNLIPVTTSGSYGTPFTFYVTRNKKARQQAEIIYFGEWAGYKIGKRHAYIRVTKAKNRWKLFLQNEYLWNPTRIDDSWLERKRELLMRKKIEVVIGYPSAMNVIAQYCRERGDKPDDFALKSFISTAEPLTGEIRDNISEVFECKVFNRYSTEEFGVLAMECSGAGNYHINNSGYKIELLSLENDTPVSYNERGRVIVTDLYSHAMPLIRYDTGDVAVMKEACTCGLAGPVFTSIEGREIESVYTPSGIRISPFAINGAMRDLDEIIQFQFIQKTESDYELKLVKMNSYNIKVEETIRKRIRKIIGSEGNVEINYVDDITPLRSGKRPYIINVSDNR